jgi:glucose/mannose-6-phosphate isomerase
MLSILRHVPEDLQEAIKSLSQHMIRTSSNTVPERVVIAGVGGSSIAGDVVSNWLLDEAPIPIVVNRGLHLPRFVDEKTLVIAISYSGDTNETLGQFNEARSRGSMLHVVTSGGRLEKVACEYGIDIARVRLGMPPRTAFPQILVAISAILLEYGVIQDLSEVKSAAEYLKKVGQTVDFAEETDNNPAKMMALRLVDKFPIIYSLERMSSVARRFKNQLNENSKVHSKFDTVPEICHNEVESWPDLASGFWRSNCSLIFIGDDGQDEREARIMRETANLLRRFRIGDFLEIVGTGSNRLSRLLSAIYICDYASFYLAIARGVDPTPIERISTLKNEIWRKNKT